MREQKEYFVEFADTFGGEANYSWCQRFKVSAASKLGAVQKLSRHVGVNWRKEYDIPDLNETTKYKARRHCLALFVSSWDDDMHSHYRVEAI